jgi:transcriptional regulator with XRE-family HTH domain
MAGRAGHLKLSGFRCELLLFQQKVPPLAGRSHSQRKNERRVSVASSLCESDCATIRFKGLTEKNMGIKIGDPGSRFTDKAHFKRVRESRGLSQGALAELAGVSRELVAGFEAGRGGVEIASGQRMWEALGEFEIALEAVEYRKATAEGALRGLKWTIANQKRLLREAADAVKEIANEEKRLKAQLRLAKGPAPEQDSEK